MANISNYAMDWIYGIVGVVLILLTAAALYDTFINATGELAATDIPLATLFASDGVMSLVYAAAVVGSVIVLLVGLTRHSRK